MNPTIVVMRKELKELFRDRRIRSNALIMPFLIMLVFLSLFSFMMGVGDKENQIIHVVKADNSLIAKLKSEKVKIVEVANEAEGEALIRQGKARLVLSFEPGFDSAVASGKTTNVKAFFDPQQETGKIALNTVQEDLQLLNSAVAEKILEEHHVDKGSLVPARIQKEEVVVGKSNVSDFLVGLLPYLIVVYAFVGGLGAASDTVAGEKEKMTLETLLITPVGRSQIAYGKFLALAVLCLTSSVSALMAVVVAGGSHSAMFSRMFPNGLGMNAIQTATIFAVLIPTVALFASMLIAVSAFAKNTREAQSYMGMMSLVVFMPAMFGQFIGLTDLASNWWIRVIPVLNTSVTLREALQGKTNPSGILITIAVGIVLAFIGIRIAVHLFKREQVLTRV